MGPKSKRVRIITTSIQLPESMKLACIGNDGKKTFEPVTSSGQAVDKTHK